ncbi:MAG: DUF3846 domain-containing protein [Butyricicoccus sp.]|nr:DUF3846 domain-containing protein [Butyricicoccus sp.]
MRILVVEPERKPKIRDIDGTLESMQETVGGLIQALYPFDDPVALVCNDEGKILGLPANRIMQNSSDKLYDVVCGVFFICGIDGDSFASLTDEQIEKFTAKFAVPEIFISLNGHLVVLPMA